MSILRWGEPRLFRKRMVLLAGALTLVAGSALALQGQGFMHRVRNATPRSVLWRVDQLCQMNSSLTNWSFPCLSVSREGGDAPGFIVLRAPNSNTHIVVSPTDRIAGTEDPALHQAGRADIVAQAWNAKTFVSQAAGRTLSADEVGMAVNSGLTRSQDQLHVHVDCVKASVRTILAMQADGIPEGRWEPKGFVYEGHPFWARRLDNGDLKTLNLFSVVREIPELAAHPERAALAVVGAKGVDGQEGFYLFATQSDPTLGRGQFTSEKLLDHGCTGQD